MIHDNEHQEVEVDSYDWRILGIKISHWRKVGRGILKIIRTLTREIT